MEVIHLKYPHQLQQRESMQPYSLALGFFDGVHRGHQAVIKAAKEEGNKRQIPTAVMTFDPHPSLVLGGRNEKVFILHSYSKNYSCLKNRVWIRFSLSTSLLILPNFHQRHLSIHLSVG